MPNMLSMEAATNAGDGSPARDRASLLSGKIAIRARPQRRRSIGRGVCTFGSGVATFRAELHVLVESIPDVEADPVAAGDDTRHASGGTTCADGQPGSADFPDTPMHLSRSSTAILACTP
jgi:hypothetical protein